MQHKISFILPVYKVERQLARCIISVLNQDYDNIEVILVDDGSPDSCPAICDNLAKQDHRIKVVHKHNEGLGMARNTGLQHATGDFVIFVDSDDYIDSDMGSKLLNACLRNNSQATYCNYRRVDSRTGMTSDNIQKMSKKLYQGKDVQEVLLGMLSNYDHSRLEGSVNMSVWHSVYDLHFLKNKNILFKSEREYISEDLMFHVDFLTQANCVAFIDDVLYNYVSNPTSLSEKYRPYIFSSSSLVYKYANTCLQSKGLANYHSYSDRYLLVISLYVINNYRKFLDKKAYKDFVWKIVNDKVWLEDVQFSSYRELPKKNKLYVLAIKHKACCFLYLLQMIYVWKRKIKTV